MGKEKYYGKHRAFVINNEDPEERGRLKLHVPDILQDNITDWARPCFPYSGDDVGNLFIPQEGDLVWAEFEGGDPNKAIWVGGTIAKPGEESEAPDEFKEDYPNKNVLKTSEGHKLIFVDDGSDPRLVVEHSSGSREIYYNADGVQGHKFNDILGDFITKADGNIKLEADGNARFLSELLMEIESQGSMTIETVEGSRMQVLSSGPMRINSTETLKMNSEMKMTVSTDEAMKIDAEMTTIDSDEIKIGSAQSNQPIVLGSKLKAILQDLINKFLMHGHISSGPGSLTTPPQNATQPPPDTSNISGVDKLPDSSGISGGYDLNSILSEKVFSE